MIKVRLVAHTPDPEGMVAAAARLCYSPAALDNLLNLEVGEAHRLIALLRERGHESPFEHASFTFVIEGVSRACSHQLVRHRLASFSQQSQRWVKETPGEPVFPPSVARNPEAARLFRELVAKAEEAYLSLLRLGIPREDARYLLPNATPTRLMVTMNARELLHVFRLRCCQRAQWEVRAVAYLMLKECRRVAPVLFARAGAPCEADGICPEGWRQCPRFPRLARAGEAAAGAVGDGDEVENRP